MKIDLKGIIIAVLSIVLLFSLMKCNDKIQKITQLQLDNQKLDSIVNLYGQVITTQESIVTNDKQALRFTDSLFNLTKQENRQIKDVLAYYKGITKTIIKEVNVPYLDTTKLTSWADSVRQRCSEVIAYYEHNTISVPRTAQDSTKNYSVKFTVRRDSLVVNSIEIPDSQYIRYVTLKGGLLKKDTYGKRHFILGQKVQVQVLHTNKYVHVLGENSVIYEPKKRWLGKTVATASAIALAYLIGTTQ